MVNFSKVLPAVIRPPVLTLDEVKKELMERFPHLKADPKGSHPLRDLDGVELFGQSSTLREGFAAYGFKMESFDCRH